MLCRPLFTLTRSNFKYNLYEPIYSGSAKLLMDNDSSSRINLHHPFVRKCQRIWKVILCILPCSLLVYPPSPHNVSLMLPYQIDFYLTEAFTSSTNNCSVVFELLFLLPVLLHSLFICWVTALILGTDRWAYSQSESLFRNSQWTSLANQRHITYLWFLPNPLLLFK